MMATSRDLTQNLLVFSCSGMVWAFSLEAVREIVPMARLSSPLGLPVALAGFLDLRGTAIPIIHLDRLFSLPEQFPGLHTPMIILRGIDGPIGILVESVRGIVPVPSARLLKIPDGQTFQGCSIAAVELDGELVHLLCPAALLGANEARSVAGYATTSQARLQMLEERN